MTATKIPDTAVNTATRNDRGRETGSVRNEPGWKASQVANPFKLIRW
jgi:hypothetical protein